MKLPGILALLILTACATTNQGHSPGSGRNTGTGTTVPSVSIRMNNHLPGLDNLRSNLEQTLTSSGVAAVYHFRIESGDPLSAAYGVDIGVGVPNDVGRVIADFFRRNGALTTIRWNRSELNGTVYVGRKME